MAARLSAFVIWALVAGCFAFWGLRLFVPSPATPSYAVSVGEATAPRGDLSRLLGAEAPGAPAAQPAAASRFSLSGVLSPKEGFTDSHGVALIAVDGRPARAYKVGAKLVDNWVLQGVTRRTASVGPAQAGAAVVLELPERPAPATGSLPAYSGGEMVTPGQPTVAPQQADQPQMEAPPPMSTQIQPPPQEVTPLESGGPGPRMGQGPPRRSESR
jgi:general secretion pathway protein C